jgi:hypothetical protein
MDIKIVGAAAFGALIGWYVYYINRHRPDQVQFGDLVTIIGVLGGGAILALFPAGSDLFGGYGIGLAIGFFGYYLTLLIFVGLSPNFNVDYFLDGRRKKPIDPWMAASGPGTDSGAAMADRPAGGRDAGAGR